MHQNKYKIGLQREQTFLKIVPYAMTSVIESFILFLIPHKNKSASKYQKKKQKKQSCKVGKQELTVSGANHS